MILQRRLRKPSQITYRVVDETCNISFLGGINNYFLVDFEQLIPGKKSLEKQKHLTVCSELGAHPKSTPGSPGLMPPNPLPNYQFWSQQKMRIILSSRNKSCKVSDPIHAQNYFVTIII